LINLKRGKKMSISLNGMSVTEMLALQKQLQEKVAVVQKEIETHHHASFIQRVGLNVLLDIPVVSAESLGLEVERKYPAGIVTPDKLGDKSVVRGLDAWNRPFIAIKVNLFDSTTGTKVAQVVEVVFKRYSLDYDERNGGYHGDNYVTALSNTGDDKKFYTSGLYSSGGMTYSQFSRVGQLLKGEKIEHQFDKRYVMQKG
jgi:hypothetical protein